MPAFQIFKETAVPGALVPNGVYIITNATNGNLLDIYVADSGGVGTRHTIREDEVQAMIDAAVAVGSGGAVIVDDIAGRDAISTPANATQVYVADASADPTVAAGGATYIYRESTTSWIKQSEAESLDLSLLWASITGGPTSTPAQIDATVTASHVHANKTQLDNIGEDGDGFMTYSGDSLVVTGALNW